MPLIASLPRASARTAALAQVWHGVVQADLATRRAVRSGDKAVPGAQLKNVLTEPFVMSIVSGTYTGSDQLLQPLCCHQQVSNSSLMHTVAAWLGQHQSCTSQKTVECNTIAVGGYAHQKACVQCTHADLCTVHSGLSEVPLHTSLQPNIVR